MSLYRFEKAKQMPLTVRPHRNAGQKDSPDDSQQYTIQGKSASDLEYFFARALDQRSIGYIYGYILFTPFQIPGQQNEIDFLISGNRPFEIDGEFSHKSRRQKESDKARDALLDEFTRPRGWEPIERVPNTEVDSLEKAADYVQENVE